MSEPVLSLKNVVRTYNQGSAQLDVLAGINLDLAAGEIIALVGPSGAGKSTLLHSAGLLEKPDSGEILVQGRDTVGLSDKARTAIRRTDLGFVYQYHHLLPEFSALENVMIPQRINGRQPAEAKEKAASLLEYVGLAERLNHRPGQLSGGEQQRVAIARALANDPVLLLADEPTGNLDPVTSGHVFEMLLGLARDVGLAALIATHNPALAERMDRIARLENGQLI